MERNMKLSKAVLHLLSMIVVITDKKNNKRNIEISSINEDLGIKYEERKNEYFKVHPNLTEIRFIEDELELVKSYLNSVKGLNDYYERVVTEWVDFLEDKETEILNQKKAKVNQKDFLQYKKSIDELGFFNLKSLKDFNEKQKEDFLHTIFINSTPYQIAMFNYLDFIKYVSKEFSFSNVEIFNKFSKIMNVQERFIKGNMNVLAKGSKENRKRYTSHLSVEKVEADFLDFKKRI